MSKGFSIARFFYAAMVGLPVFLWLIAMLLLVNAFFPSYITAYIIDIFAFLLGLASLVFGVVGFWEVFMHE